MQSNKKYKKLAALLAATMSLALIAGCIGNSSDVPDTTSTTESADSETTGADPDGDGTVTGDETGNDSLETLTPIEYDRPDFSFSDGLTDHGYWAGVTALQYVPDLTYENIRLPADVAHVDEEALNMEIEGLLNYYTVENQVTDRAVIDGDTLNIDFLGSVDGVAFDGGSTEGQGTDVTIGVTSFIDDFLEQLIGHEPGETFDIEVTFPQDYGVESLNGQDAVFEISINYIIERDVPELTDAFVSENLGDEFGWQTADDVKNDLRNAIRSQAVEEFLSGYFTENIVVENVPDEMIEYQKKMMLDHYINYAEQYQVTLDDFLVEFLDVADLEALYELSHEEMVETAKLYVIIQAIAEDADIVIDEEDVATYFQRFMRLDDYSEYEDEYGLPYLHLIVLHTTVFDYIADFSN